MILYSDIIKKVVTLKQTSKYVHIVIMNINKMFIHKYE